MSGAVVWITGLPSSGKSTLAEQLRGRLHVPSAVLDGDAVREALVPRPGYDPAGRHAFYETLARLAALLAHQGLVVIVAATANRKAYRDVARTLAPRFVEVFLDVPIEECRRRDTKHLYSASTPNLPGAGAEYERPEAPEVTVTKGDSGRAIEEVLRLLVVT